MTNAEFETLHKQARIKCAVTQYKALTELKSAYLAVADAAARAVVDAKLKNVDKLTDADWNWIRQKLAEPMKDFENVTTEIATEGTRINASIMLAIPAAYLIANGLNEYVTKEGVKALYTRVEDQVVKSAFSRVWPDGYTFSQRVWRAGESVQNDIKTIVANGIAAGRDPAKIAKDIQIYTADGQVALANRWANVERGTKAWVSRMPKSIDWRGIRLVRSELQIAVQDAGRESGLTNPASTGQYRWVLGPGSDSCAKCIENSQQTYTADNLPGYEHPSCSCQIVPILMPRDDFVSDLSAWAKGNTDESNRYLDVWYGSVYKKGT